ncbi:hypothetical protein GCM10008942_35760 [Rhizomicrobium electricum]|uniref:Uncharacterized protein n=1 Tax=Rhizomicrobium electricum TaxID=480070 RepID=A0ABP3Q5H9_9PROT
MLYPNDFRYAAISAGTPSIGSFASIRIRLTIFQYPGFNCVIIVSAVAEHKIKAPQE